MAPASLQPAALALVVVPAVISTAVLVLRVWRRTIEQKFSTEDVLLVIAQIVIVILTCTTWISYKILWYGYHAWDIPPGAVDMIKAGKYAMVLFVTYNLALGLIKTSFVITLLKLRSTDLYISISLWIIFIINALFTLIAPLLCALQCHPVQYFWDKSGKGICMDQEKLTYGLSSVIVITDVMVLIMPTWILWILKISPRRKLITILFLSLGFAVTAIGAYRLSAFYDYFNKMNNDPGYNIRAGLSNLEVCLASIGACGATVKWMLGLCIPCLRSQDVRGTPKINTFPAGSSFLSSEFGSHQKGRDGRGMVGSHVSGEVEALELKSIESPYQVPAWKDTEHRSRAQGECS